MAESPVVYLFHGDDEVAMKEAIAELKRKLGDATNSEMNTAYFAGPSISFDELINAAHAAPFLTKRRLVIVDDASKSFPNPNLRKKFMDLLEGLPSATGLVILEYIEGTEKDKEKARKSHWLLKWAGASPGHAYAKQYDLPQGAQMVAWIRERTKALGGEMQPQAAAALAQRIGNDKQAAENEIEKLLANAGYQRSIEVTDVDAVSLSIGEQGDFFGLIDALSAGNGGRAIQELESLMQERDLMMLFFSLVGHFRLLLQSRELLDAGKNDVDIARQLSIHPFRAQKLAAQARRFSIGALEAIYRRLLDYDEQVKTGEMDWDLAMESFAANLSVQAVQ